MTEPPPPILDVQCYKLFDDQTGEILVVASWQLSYKTSLEGPYNSSTALELALESIKQYYIRIDTVDVGDGTGEPVVSNGFDSVSPALQDDSGVNGYIQPHIQPWSEKDFYIIVQASG